MSQLPFRQSLAIIVGINHYQQGISPLKTAAADAVALATLLKEKHEYQVELLLNERATKAALMNLLTSNRIQELLENDRVLFYFAGHGVAADSEEGPAGYLVLHDGCSENLDSFLEMQEVYKALMALPCRHGLVILDSCFSGAFRWASAMRRAVVQREATLYKERFDRFIADPAWQVITSTSYDQTALDVLKDHRGLGQTGQHSPFAEALLDGLRGEADTNGGRDKGKVIGDGVITAAELATYLCDRVETQVSQQRTHRQTPGIWPLKLQNKGQYIFLVPGHKLNLPSAEKLTDATNPYRGLQPYDEAHQELFYGRESLTKELAKAVRQNDLTVVLGHSGTGKSSLVKAGLIPKLRQDVQQAYCVVPPFRPGSTPVQALMTALLMIDLPVVQTLGSEGDIGERLLTTPEKLGDWFDQWCQQHPGSQLLIVIDQFEELITLCTEQSRRQFLALLPSLVFASCTRVVLTLRSDFESQFSEADLQELASIRQAWMHSRFFVSPMMQDELRQAIEEPASQKVMYFEPHSLVDQIINEVVQMPGALPLLSFTLSELYRKYLQSGRNNRAMTLADYAALGGVTGALTKRATEEYEELCEEDKAFSQTVKQVMLRMVSLRGGELARRRVPLSELIYQDEEESARAQKVIQRFSTARLIVRGQEEGSESYVEPAHDALVGGWKLLQVWKNDESENLELRRLLTPAAIEWDKKKKEKKAHGLLWNDNPRLPLLRQRLSNDSIWLNRLETIFLEKSEKRRKSERRQLVSFLSIVIAVLSGITFIAVTSANAEKVARKDASARRLRAEAELEIERPGGSLTLSMLLALESLKRWPEPHLAAGLDEIFDQASLIAPTVLQLNHGDDASSTVVEAIFSNDGEWIASAGSDNTVRVWDTTTGNEIFKASHEDYVHSVSLSPNKKYVAGASKDKTVRIWNIVERKEVFRLPHDETVKKVEFSPNGKVIASGGEDNSVVLWNVESGEEISRINHQDNVWDISFSEDSNYLASASFSGEVCVLEITRTNEAVCLEHEGKILDIDFHPTDTIIGLASKNGSMVVWDFKEQLKTFEIADSLNFTSVDFSSDGKLIAAGEEAGKVRVWDAETGKEQVSLNSEERITQISFNHDGKHLITMGGEIKVWDLSSKNVTTRIQNTYDPVSFDLSPDGTKIVGSYFGSSRIPVWNIEVGSDEITSDSNNEDNFRLDFEHEGKVELSTFSQNGDFLATSSLNESETESTVTVWEVDSGIEIFKINTQKYVNGLTLDKNGEQVAINLIEGSDNHSFEIWNISDQKKLFATDAEQFVFPVEFSPRGNIAAFSSLSDEAAFTILDLNTIEIIKTEYDGLITGIDFSPDESFIGLAIASESREGIRIVDSRSGEQLRAIELPSLPTDIVFSDDGQWLASSYGFPDSDGYYAMWHVTDERKDNYKSDIVWNREEIAATSIDIGSDGKFLIVGWEDGTVDILDTNYWEDESKLVYDSVMRESGISSVLMSENSKLAINKTTSGVVYLVDVLRKQTIARRQIQRSNSRSDVAFSELGPIIAEVKDNIVEVTSLLPRNPIDTVCQRIHRNLTIDEWTQHFEGEDYPITCQNLPLPEISTTTE